MENLPMGSMSMLGRLMWLLSHRRGQGRAGCGVRDKAGFKYGEGDGAAGDRSDGIPYVKTWKPLDLVSCG
jgi:hypothetical protein